MTREPNKYYLRDYQFWIKRKIIRRGPTSWAIKKDRWVHQKTFEQMCF